MNFARLDLNLLMALDALIEERHVGRAADMLHVSQPTMSVALAKLRAHYKDDILVREGRALAPSALAESLRPLLKSFIADSRALTGAGGSVDIAQTERRFVIMINEALAFDCMPRLLPRMLQEAPRSVLTCIGVSDAAIRMFNDGQVDLVVVPKGAWLAGGDRRWLERQPHELLWEEETVCLAWAGNEAVTPQLDQTQLAGFKYIIPSFASSDMRAPADRPLADYFGMPVEVVAEMPMSVIGPTLVGTPYVCLSSARLARIAMRHHDLKIAALPPQLRGPRDLHIFWSRRGEADPAVKWLRSLLRDAVLESPRG